MIQLKCMILFIVPTIVFGCAGSSGDLTIVNNPTLSMPSFHPPAAWTYPESDAQDTLSYFPGQSLTLLDAQNAATKDITNAIIGALADIGLDSQGKTITTTYTPQLVHDCYKVVTTGKTNAAGLIIGVLENGAITKTASIGGTAALSAANCAARAWGTANPLTYTNNVLSATVSINNLQLTKYSLRQLCNSIMTKLNFGSFVQFTSEITFN
uniref:Lipoprotein n=1 Tax=Rhabditophanes sp. KR3021 TaxID=114890 RepID=A0AC35UH08_9BILA